MAIVPLRQEVRVTKADRSQTDGWGNPAQSNTTVYRVRAAEGTKVVTTPTGEEAVSSVSLLFDKLPDIDYDDTVEYTNELGDTIRKRPMSIVPKRMMSGKTILTEVHL